MNQNYTLVIVDQVTPAPNPERAVVEILSPGTIIETYDKEDSHYLISIYINRFPISAHKSIYSVGFSVIDISTNLVKSGRGEYEITDVNLYYLNNRDLYVIESNEEMRWFDVGTHDALLEASNYVARCQKEYASLIGSIEATSYGTGLINTAQLYNLIESMPEGKYKLELAKLIN